MGLVKATVDTIGNDVDDQWKEVIRCEEMTNDILMVKRKTQNGIIDNGTTIVVKPGQCVAILKNGKVIDATAEPGTFIYDDSAMATFKKGKFDKDFRNMWGEFSYSNYDRKDDSILYFNLNEIVDNKFNTSSPIELKNSNQNLTNCYGKYSLKISNPAVFMNKINEKANVYRKGRVTENIKSDISNVLKSVLGELDNNQQINELSDKGNLIRKIMQEKVLDDSIREKGFKVVGFNIENAIFANNQNNVEDFQKQINNESSFKNPIKDFSVNELNNVLNYKMSDIQDNLPNGELNNKSDDLLDLGFKYEEKVNLVTDQLENLFADEDEIRNSTNEKFTNTEPIENDKEEKQNLESYNVNENKESLDFSEEASTLNNKDPEYNVENSYDVYTDNNEEKINDEVFDNSDENPNDIDTSNNEEIVNDEITDYSDENLNDAEIDFDEEETKKIDDELFKFNEVNNNENEELKENNDEGSKEVDNNIENAEKTQINSNYLEEDTYKEENKNQDIKSQLIDFENMDNSYNTEETYKEESVVNTDNQIMVKMCLRCGNMNPNGTKTCMNCGNEL